ncbi:MAG TPA: YqhA family protein [Gammaproteobacteria bacterium]|nr:YqhA family protein [Gammaproteobacteria bacterium]
MARLGGRHDYAIRGRPGRSGFIDTGQVWHIAGLAPGLPDAGGALGVPAAAESCTTRAGEMIELFRLFITPIRVEDSKFLSALQIKSCHDLKITLMQVAVVIMVILFLEHAVEIGATLETLYFGAGVALVMSAAVFSWKNMK